jgi:spore germination cell wall hydrolase CwlJ-like protein
MIKTSHTVAGLIALGLLTKIAINTEDTKKELKVATGKIEVLEQEVKQVKAQLIATNTVTKLSPRERECLAKNVYHEAGVEPFAGKIAVAQVTLNRVNHPNRWNPDVCGVVYQKAQFSWTLTKKKVKEQPKGKLWKESLEAVAAYENGIRVGELHKATFYHTDWIKTKPAWASDKNLVLSVGRHMFYINDVKI